MTLFILMAYGLIALSTLLHVAGFVWQVALAFQESPKWGWLSVAGLFCLLFIPNLIWMIRHGKEGMAPALVILGALPIGVIGSLIIFMERTVQTVVQ